MGSQRHYFSRGIQRGHGFKSNRRYTLKHPERGSTCRIALRVLCNSAHLLQWPLIFLLFALIMAYLVYATCQVYTNIVDSLCTLPGTSVLSICAVAPKAYGVDYPAMVEIQTVNFEQLLENSASGSSLSLNVKKAEIATKDLATLVCVSTLQGRDAIASSLRQFAHEAKLTGRGLQRLSAKIDGTVDSVLAVNQYAFNSILAAIEKDASAGFLQPLINWPASVKSDAVVAATFASAMSVLSTSMTGLILAAEIPLDNLNRLEERLSTLHEIIARENADVDAGRAELLSYIWTRVGGHGVQLRNYDNHLALLSNLGEYRRGALVHVVGVLQTLHAMSDAMDDLRQRVADPELTGNSIPIDVHMSSIKVGLERLRDGRSNVNSNYNRNTAS